MKFAIEMLEQIRDAEKTLWESHTENLVFSEKESTLNAYEVRTMRLIELEEAIALLKGTPWSNEDKINFISSLEDEKYQKRKECIESITNSSAYKILHDVFMKDDKSDNNTEPIE